MKQRVMIVDDDDDDNKLAWKPDKIKRENNG